MNRCGECRHSTEDENNLYRCAKQPEFIGSFQDTSECKEFEKREINICGYCKHQVPQEMHRYYYCKKHRNYKDIYDDTSDCKDFERKDNATTATR